MAFGQDAEQELLDLIDQANEEMDEYMYPLVARSVAFSNSLVDESKLLQEEEDDLRRELEELAVQNSNGQDVTICLQIALEDADRISRDRGIYLFICSRSIVLPRI